MTEISDRKREHLDLATGSNAGSTVKAGWDDVHLIAASIPRVDVDAIDTRVELLGHALQAPFVISSMTGGHDDALPINESLAAAAQDLGVAIGSGSQRAALRQPELAKTYTVIRETAPDAVVLANIGIYQLVDQGSEPPLSQDEIETAIGMLDAQFLVVHLNAVEEAIQPEGDGNVAGLLSALQGLASDLPVQVIAKETGAGMSRETARDLVDAGVAALDVGGAGGTSFARIEGQRAAMRDDRRGERFGNTFGGWGIPTAASILEVAGEDVPVVATGGVRNGLHAAKAIALGATAVGLGSPVLKAAMEGPEPAKSEVSLFIDELRLASHLTGCGDMTALGEVQPVLTGHTKEWATQRGLL